MVSAKTKRHLASRLNRLSPRAPYMLAPPIGYEKASRGVYYESCNDAVFVVKQLTAVAHPTTHVFWSADHAAGRNGRRSLLNSLGADIVVQGHSEQPKHELSITIRFVSPTAQSVQSAAAIDMSRGTAISRKVPRWSKRNREAILRNPRLRRISVVPTRQPGQTGMLT